MPTLCTFDVRDKKTTFQTSCYVRRDIVSSLDERIQQNQPSRNLNRQASNGEHAFGLKNTLLQDSLNSVLSSCLVLSSQRKTSRKKENLVENAHKKKLLSLSLLEDTQEESITDEKKEYEAENRELTKKNEILEAKLLEHKS